jgi:pyruvate ferredoxin oxidoreductase beta subunit
MAEAPFIPFDKIRTVRDTPLEEMYTSGHRTCQGCESAMVMRHFSKAA